MSLFSYNDFGEADNFLAELIALLRAVNHFAFVLFSGSESRYGFVLVGIESSLSR